MRRGAARARPRPPAAPPPRRGPRTGSAGRPPAWPCARRYSVRRARRRGEARPASRAPRCPPLQRDHILPGRLHRLGGCLLGALGHAAAAAARCGRLLPLRSARRLGRLRRGRHLCRLRRGRGGPLEGARSTAHGGALIYQLLRKGLGNARGRVVSLGAKIHGVLEQRHAALLHFRAEGRGVLRQKIAAHPVGLLPRGHSLRHLRGVHRHVPGSRILCRPVARRLERVAGLIVVAVVVAQNVALLILGSVGWIRSPGGTGSPRRASMSSHATPRARMAYVPTVYHRLLYQYSRNSTTPVLPDVRTPFPSSCAQL